MVLLLGTIDHRHFVLLPQCCQQSLSLTDMHGNAGKEAGRMQHGAKWKDAIILRKLQQPQAITLTTPHPLPQTLRPPTHGAHIPAQPTRCRQVRTPT